MKWHIIHGSLHGIIHDQLGFYEVHARWVPKQLRGEHKET
jgi:hypothetical protein